MLETEEYQKKEGGDLESLEDLKKGGSHGDFHDFHNEVKSYNSSAGESDVGSNSDEHGSDVELKDVEKDLEPKEEESLERGELSEEEERGAKAENKVPSRVQGEPGSGEYEAREREDLEPQKTEGEAIPVEGRQKRTYFRKKVCRLCVNKMKVVDYKDVDFLRKFITERGKILPRRMTGTCAKHQRILARAIKRARIVALLPFVKK
jgi:small subunit ribosomal protein S18